MSNFEIHELTEKAINRNSNIVHDTLENGSYATGKNLAGAVADLASANVAAPYDTTVTYAIGQYCLYEGDIYRCIAITTGAFDSTKWTQIVVTGEFRRVVELTSAQYTALSSAEKNNGTLYIITDEETTADDIEYTSGVSVADKLDSIEKKSMYRKGDTVDLAEVWCFGYQGNTTSRLFFIPLPKPIESGLNVSITGTVSAYSASGASETWSNTDITTTGTISYMTSANGVRVAVILSTAVSTPMYTPLVVRFVTGILTFS